jgi:hypothetical protein
MAARRILLLGALFALPSVALAQRGGGIRSGPTGKSGVGDDITKDVARPTRKDPYSTKDLQKENMVNFLLDKKKDLKLSDDEVKSLKEINDHIKDTTKASMHSLDSLSGEMRGKGDERGDAQAARVFGPQYLADVRAQYDDQLKAALAKLTEEHQKAAQTLIDARRKELEDEKAKNR